jgi:methylated-DNA-[protein]-cysteine S-methyltransferase
LLNCLKIKIMPPVYKLMPSPVGELTLIAKDNRLIAILCDNHETGRVKLDPMTPSDSDPTLLEAEKQLSEYFAGQRNQFELDLDFVGTPFQKQVWSALLTIPFGETRSYAQIAIQIGNPKAVRAVGAANGKNPISIVAPCHRVIGSSGALIGFAGGIEMKRQLLALESRGVEGASERRQL